ncbi:MAG: hypothetical protein GY730_02735 [bacterium]|nr:hypothetical protein [bacterium]
MKNYLIFALFVVIKVSSTYGVYGNLDVPVYNYEEEELIVSNYPEEIKEPGLVLNERINKKAVRFVYYHKNISRDSFYVNFQIKNDGKEATEVKIIDFIAGPCKDGLYAGHKATKGFLSKMTSQEHKKIVILPGNTEQIIWQLIKPDSIVSGLIRVEKEESADVRVKMQFIDPSYPQLSALNYSSNGNSSVCGYFEKAYKKIKMEFNCDTTLEQIAIGDVPFLVDSKTKFQLRGNYGQVYDIDLVLDNKFNGFKRVNLYFAPVGGIARGLMVINGDVIETGFFRDIENTEAEKIREFILEPYEKRKVNILTIPQPGSFYPVAVVIQSNNTKYASLNGGY